MDKATKNLCGVVDIRFKYQWSKKAASIIIAGRFFAVCRVNYDISQQYRVFFASSLHGYVEAQDTRIYRQN